MPTYVYQCSACDKTFEVQQRITEDPLKDCDCGARDALKRLIQPIAVMFKGQGFHINDYAPKAAASGDESAAKKADAPAPACSGEPASCPACAPEAKPA